MKHLPAPFAGHGLRPSTAGADLSQFAVNVAPKGRSRIGNQTHRIAVVAAAAGDDGKGFGKQEKPTGKTKKAGSGKSASVPSQDAALRSIATRDSAPDVVSGGAPAAPTRLPSSAEERLFEERLREVRRSAEQRKLASSTRTLAPIDYDAPQPSPLPSASTLTENLPAKIGIGIAAAVFAAIFAFGDILPAPPQPSQQQQQQQLDSSGIPVKRLGDEERGRMEVQLQEYEGRLAANPNDKESLEASAVLFAELDQLDKAAERLEKLIKLSPTDIDSRRLLGEVRFEMGEYGSSAQAYRGAVELSPSESVDLLQGLTSALLADKQQQQAVDELLAARKRVQGAAAAAAAAGETISEEAADSVQVDLLLGKAYVSWGRASDAASVYDGIIARQPEDFRGYLAKGILFKDSGKKAEAEKLFLQARYLAPIQVKALVERMAAR